MVKGRKYGMNLSCYVHIKIYQRKFHLYVYVEKYQTKLYKGAVYNYKYYNYNALVSFKN